MIFNIFIILLIFYINIDNYTHKYNNNLNMTTKFD